MADPPSFFVTSLAGQNIPIVPDEFFSGKNEFMKLKLTSDAFDKTWEVKLNDRRFAGGWEDFSAAHCLRDDDVLVFRHDGDMFFHVTPSGRSFSQKKQQCVSSYEEDSDDDDNDDDDDDDSEEDNDDVVVDKEEEDETWNDDSDSMNKKKSILKADSLTSSKNSCLLAVSPFSLRKNIVNLSKPFSRSNGLDKKCCEIDLMNQSGKSWVFGLRHNKSSGQVYMIRGWRSFCRANELKPGFSYRFKLVRNGTRPLLQLCSDIAPEGNCPDKGNNKFLTITLKAYMFESGQIRLPRPFTRENGIRKAGQITLVDENGVKWPSYLTSAREQSQVYMTRGWIDFCAASKLMIGETFTLKFVRGEDTTPMLELCSKMEQAKLDGSQGTVQASRDEEETETRVQKRARVSTEGGPSPYIRASNKSSVDPKNLQCKKPLQTCSRDEEEDGQEETETQVQKRALVSTEGGPSRCTRASNKSSVDQKNLQRKQPLQPCSVSDQFANVKQSIVDILTGVRRFRSELEIKEQNLEASLQEIDALGEKC